MSLKRRAVVALLGGLILASCGSEEDRAASESRVEGSLSVDCNTVDASELSTFVVEPFQRDLAIHIQPEVARQLDEEPALICRSYESSRHGDLPAIAFAAAHRPDAEHIFPLLIVRGAKAEDALPVSARLGKTKIVEWLLAHDVDPNFGDALVHAASERRSRVVAMLLDAGAVQGLALAKAIWCAAILGLIVLRLKGVGYDERSARRVAAGALLILTTYIGVMHAATRDASQLIRRTLAERSEDVQRIMVGPVLVTPFERDVVVETPDGYIHGRAQLFPALELDLAPSKIPLLPDSSEVHAAIASPGARGFMNWARFPFAEVEETSSGCMVYLLDARYTRRRGSGFGTARVHVARD